MPPRGVARVAGVATRGVPDGTGLSLATTCHPSVQRLGHQDKLKKKKFGQKERKKGLMTVWILILMLILMIKSTWHRLSISYS